MSDLHVYHPHEGHPTYREVLADRLLEGVKIAFGKPPPEPAVWEILVAGRPEPEELAASSRLRALVIPYAGVPAVTRERLLSRPEVAVHNLHHNAGPTAELALALLLAVSRDLVNLDAALRRHDWRERYDIEKGFNLEGKRALVLGFGEIGRRIASHCRALGMRVTALRRKGGGEWNGIPIVGRDELARELPRAQVLLIALPSTDATRGWIGARELARLPAGAYLVNVGRADVVDERALYEALESRHLAGAGLDVWYRYPEDEASRGDTAPSEYPFVELPNVVLSPHMAGHGDSAERLRGEHLARSLNAAARGDPLPHRVDLAAGY